MFKNPSVRVRDVIVLLSPALAVLILVSSQLEFNHHVRYVLPVLGFTFVFTGVTACWLRVAAGRPVLKRSTHSKSAESSRRLIADPEP